MQEHVTSDTTITLEIDAALAAQAAAAGLDLANVLAEAIAACSSPRRAASPISDDDRLAIQAYER